MTLEYAQYRPDLLQDGFRAEIPVEFDISRAECGGLATVQAMGSGHVLLVGDTAHVLSPAVAQGSSNTDHDSTGVYLIVLFLFSGLTLGMCDAIALAKAISAHIKIQDSHLLLDFSTTRRARVVQVIELSGNSSSILTRIENNPFFDDVWLGLYSFPQARDRLAIVWPQCQSNGCQVNSFRRTHFPIDVLGLRSH